MQIPEVLKRKGAQAGVLLQDEAFSEAVTKLHKKYYRIFVDTDLKNSEERERLYMSVNVLKDVINELESLYDVAKAAKKAEEQKSQK